MHTNIYKRLILTYIGFTTIPLLLLIIVAFWLDFTTTIVIAIITLLGLGLVASWAIQVVQSLVAPVDNLVEAAKLIVDGALPESSLLETDDEFGSVARALNILTTRLHTTTETIEERVRERTHTLGTGAVISRQITAILDVDKLLSYVVNQIQTDFALYHTHIYLLENDRETLSMVQNSVEEWCPLKKEGDRVTVGQGIIGTVAQEQQQFLCNDTQQINEFVPHPLMPDTRSKLVIPLVKADQLIGVIDIQAREANRFSGDDVSFMQSIADQVAIAVDNLRLLAQTQTALKEVEYLNRQLTNENWQQFSDEEIVPAYHFAQGDIIQTEPEALEPWTPLLKQAIVQRGVVQHKKSTNINSLGSTITVPLILRGAVIGTMGIKRKESPNWANEELAAVEAVTNQISLALENSRLSTEQEKTIVKLQELDRLKSEFLTSMSHELRTPLNAILGFADILLQGIDGELTEYAQNDIQLIYNSGQHLLTLINDILDISKIEAGMMEIVPEIVEVIPLVDEVIAASDALVKDKSVKVIKDIPDEMPDIYADSIRLKQILLNLISNASKFTSAGSITVQACVPEEETEWMHFTIIDTGIGIPEDKQDAVFERFKQADMTTTKEFGGTGLGLAICKQLVEMHGGEIGLQSEVGVGSQFYFTIPLAKNIRPNN
ncbi:ATP-binding protein [Anaerolineales bacterium HSG24]|nr:ATP-binding protein [Anaerolineales bacterium HSG24]